MVLPSIYFLLLVVAFLMNALHCFVVLVVIAPKYTNEMNGKWLRSHKMAFFCYFALDGYSVFLWILPPSEAFNISIFQTWCEIAEWKLKREILVFFGWKKTFRSKCRHGKWQDSHNAKMCLDMKCFCFDFLWRWLIQPRFRPDYNLSSDSIILRRMVCV